MPIYDYACTVCGRVVEVVHGVNGQGPEACATCGGPMRKLLSTPAVHFKGSGWAKKDRGASSTTKAAARSGSSSDEGSRSGSDEARRSDRDGQSDRGSESRGDEGRRSSGDEGRRSSGDEGRRSSGDQVKSKTATSESAKKEPTGASATSGVESA